MLPLTSTGLRKELPLLHGISKTKAGGGRRTQWTPSFSSALPKGQLGPKCDQSLTFTWKVLEGPKGRWEFTHSPTCNPWLWSLFLMASDTYRPEASWTHTHLPPTGEGPRVSYYPKCGVYDPKPLTRPRTRAITTWVRKSSNTSWRLKSILPGTVMNSHRTSQNQKLQQKPETSLLACNDLCVR
jgi:hypothetical protein